MVVLSTGCLLLVISVWDQTKESMIQSGIESEVIRFHVRANSEDMLDQEIKIKVKDAVVEYLYPLLGEVETVDMARNLLCQELSKIDRSAEEVLKKYGCSYGAKVFFRKEYFPQKTYGDCTFPAGEYFAVVIELGQGQGHNWWCMLYPGLCFVDETFAIVSEEKKEDLQHMLTKEEYDWVTNPKERRISFKCQWIGTIVDGIAELFG